MKEEILVAIYKEFENWSSRMHFACRKGCASCCTQNVTLTALEGSRIHAFIQKQQKEQWFAEILQSTPPRTGPRITSNDYASLCIQGQEADPDEGQNLSPCPFLAHKKCLIYEVRPFSCRCFASLTSCTPHQPAELPEYYISASTAIMQLIEHLGQFDLWGNMLDVLQAQCYLPPNQTTTDYLVDKSLPIKTRKQILKAKPLPGFLIPEEDYRQIEPLLTEIFSSKIEEKTIEQILNNH